MARNAARLKMGHFPLPEVEAHKIRSLLSCSSPCSVVDPCAGKGTAFNLRSSSESPMLCRMACFLPGMLTLPR
jgi:hypothetical protein